MEEIDHIILNQEKYYLAECTKFLGVNTDKNLNWGSHVNYLGETRVCNYRIKTEVWYHILWSIKY